MTNNLILKYIALVLIATWGCFSLCAEVCDQNRLIARGSLSTAIKIKTEGGEQHLPSNNEISIESVTNPDWGYSSHDYPLNHDLVFSYPNPKNPSIIINESLTVQTFDKSTQVYVSNETFKDGTAHTSQTALVLGSHLRPKQNFNIRVNYEAFNKCNIPTVDPDSCVTYIYNYSLLPHSTNALVRLPTLTCNGSVGDPLENDQPRTE